MFSFINEVNAFKVLLEDVSCTSQYSSRSLKKKNLKIYKNFSREHSGSVSLKIKGKSVTISVSLVGFFGRLIFTRYFG